MDFLNELLQEGIVTAEASAAISKHIEEGMSPERALLGGGVPREVVRDRLAKFYNVPAYAPAEDETIPQNVLEFIPVEAAKNYRLIPLRLEDSTLLVGVNDPEDFRLREVLNFVSVKHGIPYKYVFLLEDDLNKLLAGYDSLTGEVGQALTSLEGELDDEIATRKSEDSDAQREAAEHMKEDAPVTKIVATILRYAVDGAASDIHVEPTNGKVKVRFRVDGILQTSLELPRNVQASVVARIKILSAMRLDERRKPQDGRFSATFDGRKIDFRVSTFPTSHGEKVVMRILDNEKGIRTLDRTGISPHHLATIRKMIKEPYGIILISGPTGSGKSTTLYAMLSEIDRTTKNVLSLEDPIEYNIENVAQSQVRPEIGYTFANGLRTALRQDPDVILVGEIRDKETAQLAIQAALTGHLVLSTIHTNNAIGVVPRLIDMGVDPYLIAPTLKLAIAQRLARRLCKPGQDTPVDESTKRMFEKEFESLPSQYRDQIPAFEKIYHPVPSPGCASGSKGRVAVMEVLEVDQEIQDLILNSGSEAAMYKSARAKGFISMKEDAIIKALAGDIPYEEVNTFGTKVGEAAAIDREYLPGDTALVETAPAAESKVETPVRSQINIEEDV
jgi:type II secretory ATPase GspE/PulE/Tfp pilus assembly ATPase PilB-like protein